jgi:hypothetical protein
MAIWAYDILSIPQRMSNGISKYNALTPRQETDNSLTAYEPNGKVPATIFCPSPVRCIRLRKTRKIRLKCNFMDYSSNHLSVHTYTWIRYAQATWSNHEVHMTIFRTFRKFSRMWWSIPQIQLHVINPSLSLAACYQPFRKCFCDQLFPKHSSEVLIQTLGKKELYFDILVVILWISYSVSAKWIFPIA